VTLKESLAKLRKESSETKSAIISWGNQSRQIFFEEPEAIPAITQKIKDCWAIPRKVYWLQINGQHEERITSWPKQSTILINIRGLVAGE
jgi:hypothetical protein